MFNIKWKQTLSFTVSETYTHTHTHAHTHIHTSICMFMHLSVCLSVWHCVCLIYNEFEKTCFLIAFMPSVNDALIICISSHWCSECGLAGFYLYKHFVAIHTHNPPPCPWSDVDYTDIHQYNWVLCSTGYIAFLFPNTHTHTHSLTHTHTHTHTLTHTYKHTHTHTYELNLWE